MIIDFSYPNLHVDGWKVKVVRSNPDGELDSKTHTFNDKDEAFAFYDKVHAMWIKEKAELRESIYVKENQATNHR